MKRILFIISISLPAYSFAQGIDFMAIERGRQQAQDYNYQDQLRQQQLYGSPNGQYNATQELREIENRRYRNELLAQQRRQNELLQQQLDRGAFPSSTTTDCQPNGFGGVRCTTR
ncbi:hypothetical protein JHL22_00605 [Advenella sp. WQ 585]|uniref:Uncharacterized protein n=1 Tax=Advenella mandrilli TaxID=2800330 RepID=A0ABS1EE12_9BURK|nr:hypothetical protein [Advenella mandrilli]MBK1779710.1 hypothetical protein [Advenella mandrilli]